MALLLACARAPAVEPGPPPTREPPPPPPERPTPEVIRVGVLVPQTGSPYLTQYGDLVMEGVSMALAERVDDGRRIELVVRDDGGSAARAAALTRELTEAGVVGIVGPLLSDALTSAANARPDPAVSLISPTASARAAGANVYSLNAGDVSGAEALGAYAVRRGYAQIATLFPATADFRRQAEAFAAAVREAGGRVVLQIPFDSSTTTFADPLDHLHTAGVTALFVPATEREIEQLAPQIEYYGLSGVQLLGNDAWISDEVIRQVPARILEGVIATTPLPKGSPLVGWDAFVGRYEATQRHSLDTPYPALGYDAMRLLLQALPDGRVQRSAVAARLAATEGFKGASGIISVHDGEVVRRPFLMRFTTGMLVPLDAGGR